MENSTIIKVIQNVHKMIENRGFDITRVNQNPPMAYLKDIIKLFRDNKNSLDIFIENPSANAEVSGKKIYVHFIFNMKNPKSSKEIEDTYETIKKSNNMTINDHIVFVIFNDVNEKLQNLELEYDNVTIFNYKKLMFNIVDHEYVPKHEKLSAEEKIKLLSDFMIRSYDKLPLLSKQDPVCRYYNFRQNDVIKITRPSSSNKFHILYRFIQVLHD
tara:strand:+ start:1237 stop:1881 length:645 start_codon:yes stop_codon:yes gene_type:complete